MAEQKPAGGRKARRSPRRELVIPIRVFGTSLKGRGFSEDCICVKVSRHGAQIRLKHSLIPDEIIHIVNLKKKKEAAFRVVGQAASPPGAPYADWGVEALDPNTDIWSS